MSFHLCFLFKQVIDHYIRYVERKNGKIDTVAVAVYECTVCKKQWEEVD